MERRVHSEDEIAFSPDLDLRLYRNGAKIISFLGALAVHHLPYSPFINDFANAVWASTTVENESDSLI